MHGLVHSDMVGVPVTAVRAIGQHCMWTQRDKVAPHQVGGLLHAVDQGPRILVSGRAFHAGIAEVPETTQLNTVDA